MIHLGWKTMFKELMNEIWEVGRVMIQKSCLLVKQVSLMPSWTKLYLSWPHTIKYRTNSVYSMPIQCTSCYLKPIWTSMGLKTRISRLFRKDGKKINLLLTTIMTFSSFGLVVAYSIFTYFILDLMTFIYFVLKLYRVT